MTDQILRMAHENHKMTDYYSKMTDKNHKMTEYRGDKNSKIADEIEK
jgi:hypothetical protein